MIRVTGTYAVIVLALIASNSFGQSASRQVRQQDYGNDWPFPRFPSGIIYCRPTQGISGALQIVTIKLGAIEYGLNGTAMNRGYPTVNQLIPKDEYGDEILGKAVAANEMLKLGLSLCGGDT